MDDILTLRIRVSDSKLSTRDLSTLLYEIGKAVNEGIYQGKSKTYPNINWHFPGIARETPISLFFKT